MSGTDMNGSSNADDVRQFTVGKDDDGVRLDRWFKRNLPAVGFATVSRWARTGQLRVDGKRADVDTRLEKGQILRVPPGGSAPAGIKGTRVTCSCRATRRACRRVDACGLGRAGNRRNYVAVRKPLPS